MRRTIEITGEEFREKLQGEHAFFLTGGSEFRGASANYQASVKDKGTIPWQIPSVIYYPDSGSYGQMRLNNLPEDQRDRPIYKITTDVKLGGTKFTYPEEILNKFEFPCVINIYECVFQSTVDFEYITSNYSLNFENCVFEGNLTIKEVNFKNVNFKKCVFSNSSLEFKSSKIEGVEVNLCKSNYVRIFLSDIENILFSQTIEHQANHIHLLNSTLKEINLNGDAHGTINIKNTLFDKINISCNKVLENSNITTNVRIYFKKLFFDLEKNNTGNIIIKNTTIDELEITGHLSSTFHVKDCDMKYLFIKDFINDGRTRFHNLTVLEGGKVEIIDSQLNKAEFNYVDFDRVQHFSIYLTNLQELITNNTIFPGQISGRSSDDYSGKREIYRQLKNSAVKQGDRVSELRYEKFEMYALEQVYGNSQQSGAWTDRLILWTNKHTNAHGQHWLRALKVLFIGTIIFYIALKLEVTTNFKDHLYTLNNLAQYLNFSLNPLHKLKEVFPESSDTYITPLAEVLDVFGKLFSGYMIFQFLRAFRKFAK